SPGGPVPTPMPMPFKGKLSDGLCQRVEIEDCPAAVEGSKAKNEPAHVPTGGSFQKPPSDEGTVQIGAQSVLFEDKPAARHGDVAITCNDPADKPGGTVIAQSSVLVGE